MKMLFSMGDIGTGPKIAAGCWIEDIYVGTSL